MPLNYPKIVKEGLVKINSNWVIAFTIFIIAADLTILCGLILLLHDKRLDALERHKADVQIICISDSLFQTMKEKEKK